MSWIVFLAFGLVVGLIARLVVPGRQPIGIIATTLLGCVGSVIGGFVGNLVAGVPMRGLIHGISFATMHPAGWIGSIIGAVVLLGIYVLATRRSFSERAYR